MSCPGLPLDRSTGHIRGTRYYLPRLRNDRGSGRLGLQRKLNADEQETVCAWLRGLSAACEEIYKSYCMLAEADAFVGRARLIGHCIRELRVGLLAGFVGEQTERLDYRRELRAIGKQLDTESGATLDPSANADVPDSTPATVGPDAARMIRDLIGKSEAKTATLVDQFAEMFRQIRLEPGGPQSSLRTIAKEFKSVTATEGIAHSRKTDAELLDDDFVARLAAFEDYLHNFATAHRFVARLETLDDILDQANRSAG